MFKLLFEVDPKGILERDKKSIEVFYQDSRSLDCIFNTMYNASIYSDAYSFYINNFLDLYNKDVSEEVAKNIAKYYISSNNHFSDFVELISNEEKFSCLKENRFLIEEIFIYLINNPNEEIFNYLIQKNLINKNIKNFNSFLLKFLINFAKNNKFIDRVYELILKHLIEKTDLNCIDEYVLLMQVLYKNNFEYLFWDCFDMVFPDRNIKDSNFAHFVFKIDWTSLITEESGFDKEYIIKLIISFLRSENSKALYKYFVTIILEDDNVFWLNEIIEQDPEILSKEFCDLIPYKVCIRFKLYGCFEKLISTIVDVNKIEKDFLYENVFYRTNTLFLNLLIKYNYDFSLIEDKDKYFYIANNSLKEFKYNPYDKFMSL